MPLPTIEYDGRRFVLGCLPPYARCGLPDFSVTNPVIPRAQWPKKQSMRPLGIAIKDQTEYNACVGHAASVGAEYAAAFLGRNGHELSAWFIYSNIDGGVDQGAVVSDAMTCLISNGTCLDSEVAYGTILKSRLSAQSYSSAKNYRIDNAYKCRNFDEIVSAILLDRSVVFGIPVGQNFTAVNRECVCPIPDVIIGGHALCAMGLSWSNLYNEPVVEFQNSWGSTFGDSGFAYLREAHFNVPWLDAFAIESVIDNPADTTDEPPSVS